ncbi:MAG: cell division protein FtsA [Cryomorphaceae bacterium]|nr:cell division protein FtsA [Cryomorphaceae bacterium]
MENKIGKYAVGLDLGTTKIVAIIGRFNEHGKLEILGHGKALSLGIHRGVVNNILQTVESIKLAVSQAEAIADLKISSVVAGIAGQHIRSLQHSDYVTREDPDSVIDKKDIVQLIENVEKLSMLPGEKIIHVLPQEYKIDGQNEVKEPVGMYGARLEANFHIVIGQLASIRNIDRCIKNAGLTGNTITLEPLASAEAVLSQEEKEAGVVLVDIGGGTTDVAIFKDNIIRHTAVIPFGGNVITNDIKEGCSIIEKQAEQLKVRFGSAWPGENKENEIVSIPGLRGREGKEISLKKLSQIIHSRVVEIIDQVFMEIKNYGYNEPSKKLIAGIVLTGGGAQLKHIRQLVEYVTGMDTRIGYSDENLASGSPKELSTPMYATGIGLLLEGLRIENAKDTPQNEEIPAEETIEASAAENPEENLPPSLDAGEEKVKAKARTRYLDWVVDSIKKFINDDVN